jgi:hypothetical protein
MRNDNRSSRLKDAIIAAFTESAPSMRVQLDEFSVCDWKKIMFWLDVSGLALYLLDQLILLGVEDCVPWEILMRLWQNLDDNRKRTASLFNEAIAVNEEFRKRKITFALLKGITLWPESVPNIALRCQVDLDLLVRDSDATEANAALGRLGYEVCAVSGNTREYKAGAFGTTTLKDIYKVRKERALDLHLLSAPSGRCDRLNRADFRRIKGEIFRVLSPPDVLVQQAIHLFKHMCSEHTRAFWVLEFWRHVMARHDDLEFWRTVDAIAANEWQADIAIGGATMLTTLMFGEFAPYALTRWSDQLPPGIRLWIQMYGRRILLSDSPCSKLYLLLRPQLVSNPDTVRAARRRLMFPVHLPPRVTRGETGEPFVHRLNRYWAQTRFTFLRMRFHAGEGLRFAIESLRWQRRLTGLTQ